MLKEQIDRVGKRSKHFDDFALATPLAASIQGVEVNLNAERSDPRTQELRYQVALDSILVGVCYFDGQERMILCNRRYAEVYGLSSEQVRPGATMREISESCAAAGSCPAEANDGRAYYGWCSALISSAKPSNWTIALKNGRTVKVHHQPTPDGGWVSTHEDITGLQDRGAAADTRLSLQTLIDWVPDNLWVKDNKSRFVIANKATALRMGFTDPEALIGKTDLELCPPDLARQYFADERRVVETGQPMIDKQEFAADPLKRETCISTTKVPLRNDVNEIFGIVGVSRDITDRVRAEAARDEQAAILEMIATGAPLDAVLDRIVRAIDSQLTGLSASILLLDQDRLHLRRGAAPSLAKGYSDAIDSIAISAKAGPFGASVFRCETVIVADVMKDALWEDYRDFAVTYGLRSCWSTPIISHHGRVLGTLELFSESVREPTDAETRLIMIATRTAGIAVERKLDEDRIHFLANHDPLTGLPNRSLLDDRLSQAILYAQRYDREVVVVFIDLDNFKLVNDSLGHNAGDEVLKQTTRRMAACLRATDTLIRLGGDEFVIVLSDQPKGTESVSCLLQKLRAAIAAPLLIEGHTLRVTASIGVASYPNDGTDGRTLLTSADSAVYRAKEIGRDNFQFYTPDLNIKARDRLLLQEELRNAIVRNEFLLFYQPQLDLLTGRIFAVEALIRWRHPKRGLISPDKFIPMAEETGHIVPLGDWVLHEACRQNKAWQDAGLPHMNVCVNVSARQFNDKSLIANVIDALQESGLEAKYLEIEVTESLIMQDAEAATATMKELQGLGVQFSIDDFGTGYSSLSALSTFPVCRLKIDKSFITDLTTNEHHRVVTSAVISLGRKLQLKVIAEGVETVEQLAFLRENNCDEMQGYYLSKPVEANELGNLVKMSVCTAFSDRTWRVSGEQFLPDSGQAGLPLP